MTTTRGRREKPNSCRVRSANLLFHVAEGEVIETRRFELMAVTGTAPIAQRTLRQIQWWSLKRLTGHLVAAVSAMICIAALLYWFRSYTTAAYFAWCGQTKEIGLISTVGRLVLHDEGAIAPFQWPGPPKVAHSAVNAPATIDASRPGHVKR